jgi:hypothetical protein
MAKRIIYCPNLNTPGTIEKEMEFQWFPGFSISQKQKSISSLHKAAEETSITPVLEISTKSRDPLGIKLSAFNLVLNHENKRYTVEAIFQSGKFFSEGGPYFDLLNESPKNTKKDQRLKTSGDLQGFSFFGEVFSLTPKTFFYDWLYLKALNQNENLSQKLLQYSGFTDIEFNPKKSLNCQASSAALYVSLVKNGLFSEAIRSKVDLLRILKPYYIEKQPNTYLTF